MPGALPSARQDTLVLADEEVHVWCVSLDRAGEGVPRVHALLAADERSRAGRFVFPQDRDRWVAARGALRLILGRYLGCAPERVALAYGEAGKPRLAGPSGGEAIRFNLSHSQGLALYAMARGREVGVDLERLRPEFPCTEVAEQVFSPEELATLRRLPPARQPTFFFTCWTIKEAYVKATGRGLGWLGWAPERRSHGDTQGGRRWSVQTLAPAPGYVGALVVEQSRAAEGPAPLRIVPRWLTLA